MPLPPSQQQTAPKFIEIKLKVAFAEMFISLYKEWALQLHGSAVEFLKVKN